MKPPSGPKKTNPNKPNFFKDSRRYGENAGLGGLTGSEPHSAYEGRKAGAGSRVYRMERRVPGAGNDTHGRLAGRLETLPCR